MKKERFLLPSGIPELLPDILYNTVANMEIDKETLADLSIFGKDEQHSVFGYLNYTRTNGGRNELAQIFKNPLQSSEDIRQMQDTVRYMQKRIGQWPLEITNGTVMVIEKYLEANDYHIPANVSLLGGMYYRIFMQEAYSVVRYSLSHIYTFLKSMVSLSAQFTDADAPLRLKKQIQQITTLLDRPDIQHFLKAEQKEKLPARLAIRFGHSLKYRYGQTILKLMQHYYKLDAWYSMAVAVDKLRLSFPEFTEGTHPELVVEQLYHPLLKNPVAYDLKLDRETNFLFLTGANMAGKSTFIKAVGLSVYLAHLGMGVPAKKMQLSFFEGLLSNIQVQDNIFLGESYFYNEVQRVKKTILKINNGKKWLILIDELFKGTNFQDAKQCSVMVIEGLLKMKKSLFVLSTHLYEIAEPLKSYPNITFRYFETTVENEDPRYSYQLKNGISNDRLGFLILKREKVLELLQKI